MCTISDSIIQAQVLKVVKNVHITPDCGYFFELINEEARIYRDVSDDGSGSTINTILIKQHPLEGCNNWPKVNVFGPEVSCVNTVEPC